MSAAIQLLEAECASFDAEIIEIQKLKEEIELREKIALDRKQYVVGLISRAKEADAKQADEDKKAAAIQKRLATLEANKKTAATKKTGAKEKAVTANVIDANPVEQEKLQELPK